MQKRVVSKWFWVVLGLCVAIFSSAFFYQLRLFFFLDYYGVGLFDMSIKGSESVLSWYGMHICQLLTLIAPTGVWWLLKKAGVFRYTGRLFYVISILYITSPLWFYLILYFWGR